MAGQPPFCGTDLWLARGAHVRVDKNILDRLDNPNDARVTFLHDRISQLQKEAGEHGGALFVTHGDPIQVLADLAVSGQVRAVYTNEDYEPYA